MALVSVAMSSAVVFCLLMQRKVLLGKFTRLLSVWSYMLQILLLIRRNRALAFSIIRHENFAPITFLLESYNWLCESDNNAILKLVPQSARLEQAAASRFFNRGRNLELAFNLRTRVEFKAPCCPRSESPITFLIARSF